MSKRYGVPTSRIFSWRSNARFQSDRSEFAAFTPVEVVDPIEMDKTLLPQSTILPVSSIKITLENGRKLSVSDGVDARFFWSWRAVCGHALCTVGREDLADVRQLIQIGWTMNVCSQVFREGRPSLSIIRQFQFNWVWIHCIRVVGLL